MSAQERKRQYLNQQIEQAYLHLARWNEIYLTSGDNPNEESRAKREIKILKDKIADLEKELEGLNKPAQASTPPRLPEAKEKAAIPTPSPILEDMPEEKETRALPQEMVLVEGGSFQMGSENGNTDETPVHLVTLSDYYIGRTPLRVAQYRAYTQENGLSLPFAPSWGWQDGHPIINVSWYDAARYCNWRSQKEGYAPYYIFKKETQVSYNSQSKGYRLPSEAQWEYAARGGKRGKGQNYSYSGGNDLDSLGWYGPNANAQTQALAQLSPNALGLYDMSGNVWEWCDDGYTKYPSEAQTNPIYLRKTLSRVLRGGSWVYTASYCRVANRLHGNSDNLYNDVGFRLSRTP